MKMTFRRILVGGVTVFLIVVAMVVIMPNMSYNPTRTIIAHPYTPEEERGRVLFYSNGCNYCHTQYVRPEDTGMGPVADGGNYYFDNPVILGSERTGPDLSYIGRKHSEAWEIGHLAEPRLYSPMSIMPSFGFLTEEDRAAIATYLFSLGNRYAAQFMILPPDTYANLNDPLDYPEVTPEPDGGALGWATWRAADMQQGKELYVDRCLTCHGCAGNGLGSYGGTLVITPANFKQEPFSNMPADQWFWHVSEGVQGSVMPPWKASLSETERWQVIRYIRQIFAGPVMRDPDEGDPPADYAGLTNPVALTNETLDQGKHIFIRECRICHGDSGRGDGPYIQGLEPPPPDFSDGSYGTLDNPSYTDADYFWRISEGLPWSAMPAWKLIYSADDRWLLVHYLRTVFTQTETPPPSPDEANSFVFPDVYAEQTMPDSASYERGRVVFLQNCAHCHGLAGDGQGWDGQYLNPQPADFRDMAGMPVSGSAQGEHLAKLTFGILNTAMPSWGEVLPEAERWDAIKYLMASFMQGQPVTESVYTEGAVAADYVTLSPQNWTDTGHSISSDHGGSLYATYCATCHGDRGQSDGPGTEGSASGGPAAFPNDLPQNYIFWRTSQGVPASVMPPFSERLSETDVWDITGHIQQLTSG